MKLYGITGQAGAGKDTFAYNVAPVITMTLHPFRVMHFADPLRDVAEAVFGSRFETQEEKAKLIEWAPKIAWAAEEQHGMPHMGQHDVTGRRVLQFIGTEMFRQGVHPDIWVMAMDRRITEWLSTRSSRYDLGEPVIMIPDVRFENEAAYVHKMGGKIIQVINKNQKMPKDQHASAQPLPATAIDFTFRFSSVFSNKRKATWFAKQIMEGHV